MIIASKAREGMSCAPARRYGRASGNSDKGELRGQVLEKSRFAPSQVGRACNVDHKPVWRIGGGDRREAAQRPMREAGQGFEIAVRVRVVRDQIGRYRRGMSNRQSGGDAKGERGAVCGDDHALAAHPPDEGDRRLTRRRVRAFPAPPPIGRKCRQVDRDDPSHRRLPG